jgi:hypothetical protein
MIATQVPVMSISIMLSRHPFIMIMVQFLVLVFFSWAPVSSSLTGSA